MCNLHIILALFFLSYGVSVDTRIEHWPGNWVSVVQVLSLNYSYLHTMYFFNISHMSFMFIVVTNRISVINDLHVFIVIFNIISDICNHFMCFTGRCHLYFCMRDRDWLSEVIWPSDPVTRLLHELCIAMFGLHPVLLIFAVIYMFGGIYVLSTLCIIKLNYT